MKTDIPKRAGSNIAEFCQALDISRPTFYDLKVKPKMVRIGRRVIVVESPEAYLNRLAEMQAHAQEAAA